MRRCGPQPVPQQVDVSLNPLIQAESQLQEILDDGTCIIKNKEGEERIQEALLFVSMNILHKKLTNRHGTLSFFPGKIRSKWWIFPCLCKVYRGVFFMFSGEIILESLANTYWHVEHVRFVISRDQTWKPGQQREWTCWICGWNWRDVKICSRGNKYDKHYNLNPWNDRSRVLFPMFLFLTVLSSVKPAQVSVVALLLGAGPSLHFLPPSLRRAQRPEPFVPLTRTASWVRNLQYPSRFLWLRYLYFCFHFQSPFMTVYCNCQSVLSQSLFITTQTRRVIYIPSNIL